ncbi:MAG: hypothetical protein AAGA75_18005 [Cyanobacteria bacterium P01_E01_bin.6]
MVRRDNCKARYKEAIATQFLRQSTTKWAIALARSPTAQPAQPKIQFSNASLS